MMVDNGLIITVLLLAIPVSISISIIIATFFYNLNYLIETIKKKPNDRFYKRGKKKNVCYE